MCLVKHRPWSHPFDMHPYRRRADEVLATIRTPTRTGSIPGVSADWIENAVRAGGLVRLAQGVVVSALVEHDDLMTQARVAQMRYPTSVVSHTSAARLHGIPYFAAPDDAERLHVIVQGAARRRGALIVHDLSLHPHEQMVSDGVAVTTPLRTALDVGLSLSTRWAVAALDAVLRRRVATLTGVDAARDGGPVVARRVRLAVHESALRAQVIDEVAAAVSALGRRHGIANLRDALVLVDPVAESPLESLSRVAIRQSRLPEPSCGHEVRVDASTYWADFAWPEFGVIGEADGAGKYELEGALARQVERQSMLERAGWVLVRWTWDDVFPNPLSMLVRLNEALRTARRRIGASIPA